jgi:hypothetical protein
MPKRKCAIIIGVNKTGGMPVLSAAVSGAENFDLWAKSQNYETYLFTDDTREVSVREVKKVVRTCIDKAVYDTVIIYFAGHGFLRSPSEEIWLLSGAPDDANEAINLGLSRYLARRCGIPHIVFISDACRTAPSSVYIAGVSGSALFPNMQHSARNCDCDVFYATEMGDPSHEIRAGKDGTNYYGIYTNCLLKGLRGDVPEVIREVNDDGESFAAVLSYELKEYLSTAVPAAAEEFSITLVQNPDAEVTSRSPKYLSRVKKRPKRQSFDIPEIDGMHFRLSLDYKPIVPIDASRIRAQERIRNVEKLIAAGQELAPSIITGFNVIGGEAKPLFIHAINRRKLSPNESKQQFNVRSDRGSTMLLSTKSGITPLAVLPGFVGNVLIDHGKVVNVNYLPGVFSKRRADAKRLLEEVGRRRALIASNARFGKFELLASVDNIIGDAGFLRYYKALDPTLGLYAAYAYLQANDLEDIRSVYEYMDREKEPILYDVDLLARLEGQRPNSNQFKVRPWHRAPFCPLLTQGWSYLELVKEEEEHLRALKRQLVPGLWTTFRQTAFSIIRDLDYKHEIL